MAARKKATPTGSEHLDNPEKETDKAVQPKRNKEVPMDQGRKPDADSNTPEKKGSTRPTDSESKGIVDVKEMLHQCQEVHPLKICELAHRDSKGTLLWLRDDEFEEDKVRAHMKQCDECKRWYENATTVYRVKEKPPAVLATNEADLESGVRGAEAMAVADPGKDFSFQKLIKKETGAELDKCDVELIWRKAKHNNRSVWWLALKVPRPKETEGSKLFGLPEGSHWIVDIQQTSSASDSEHHLETRLRWDADGNLASTLLPFSPSNPTEDGADFEYKLSLVRMEDDSVGD